tara:strand:+ start:329 stop:874 length:546 start_codon:yes stop_codon:yes gene_type:complete
MINRLSIFSVLFLSLTGLYSQKEYNIISLEKIEGIYKIHGKEKLPKHVKVYKIEKNKKRYLGKLLDGKKSGPWIEVYHDLRILVENYRDGKLDGPISLFYKNGQKEWRYNYAKGILNGTYNRWHENGQKAIDGYFEGGQPIGIWAWWDETGKFLKKQKYPQKKYGITKNHNQYTDKIDIYN